MSHFPEPKAVLSDTLAQYVKHPKEKPEEWNISTNAGNKFD